MPVISGLTDADVAKWAAGWNRRPARYRTGWKERLQGLFTKYLTLEFYGAFSGFSSVRTSEKGTCFLYNVILYQALTGRL